MSDRGRDPARSLDLCDVDAVPEGGALRVETNGLTLAVFKVEGAIFVIDDHCTHGPGSLSEGWLSGHEVECDFHQGCFDVRTGQVTSPPPMIPVRTYAGIVEAGRVRIDPEPDRPATG